MYANQDVPTWLPGNGGALPPFAVSAPPAIGVHQSPFCCVPPSISGPFTPAYMPFEYDGSAPFAEMGGGPAILPPFGIKCAGRPPAGGVRKAAGTGAFPMGGPPAPFAMAQPKAMESSAPEHILFESNVEGTVVSLPGGVARAIQDPSSSSRRDSELANAPGRLMYECSGESFYLSFDHEDVLPLAHNVLCKFPPFARRGPRELRVGDRVSFSVLMHRFKGDARATKIRVTMGSLLSDVESAHRGGGHADNGISGDGDAGLGGSVTEANVVSDEAQNSNSFGTSSCVPDSPASTNSAYSALFAASNLVGVGVGEAGRATQPCEVAMHSLALRKFRGTVCVVRDKFGFIERGREHALRHDKNIFFHFSEFHGPASLIRVGLRVEFQITIANSASNGPRLCAVNVKPTDSQALATLFSEPGDSSPPSPHRSQSRTVPNPHCPSHGPSKPSEAAFDGRKSDEASPTEREAPYVPSAVELAAFESMRRFIDAQTGIKRVLCLNDAQKSDGAVDPSKASTHIGIVVSPFVRHGEEPAPPSGLIVLKSNGITQNVAFGDGDQCGSYLLLPGDLVQFELLDVPGAPLKRATRIRLLRSTFEHTKERRRRGFVSALHVALDQSGKLCGHGRVVELDSNQGPSQTDYPFTLNEVIDTVGNDQPTLRLDELVEFSVAKFDVDHAVRIVRLQMSLEDTEPLRRAVQVASRPAPEKESAKKGDKQQPVRKQSEQRTAMCSSPVSLERRIGFVVALVPGSDEYGPNSSKSGFGFIEFATHEGEIYFSAKACLAYDDAPSTAFRSLQLGDAVEMQVQPPLMSPKEAKATSNGTQSAADPLASRENDKCYTRPSAVAVRKIRDWPFGSLELPTVPDSASDVSELRSCETAFCDGSFVGYVRKQMKTCMTYPGVITVTHATARSADDVAALNVTGVGFTPLSFLRTSHGQQLTLNVGDRVAFRLVQVREVDCLAAAERAAEGKKNCRPVAFAHRAMFVELLERRAFRGRVTVLNKSLDPLGVRQLDDPALGWLSFHWPSDLRPVDVPSSLADPANPSDSAAKLLVAYVNAPALAQTLAIGDEVDFALMYSNGLKRFVASDLRKLQDSSDSWGANSTALCKNGEARARPSSTALPQRSSTAPRVTLIRQPRGPPDSSAKGFDTRCPAPR